MKDKRKASDKQEVKEYLTKNLVKTIQRGKEFEFLEKLCNENKLYFGQDIIDYCLDIYLDEISIGSEKFKSKYTAMWKTSWYIYFR